MPLIADAYAEAHLDLTTLDRDLVEAARKLATAFERIEEQAEVEVTVDTNRALAQLGALEAAVSDLSAEVDLDVNTDEALAKLAALNETAERVAGTIVAEVEISDEEALADLAAVEIALQRIERRATTTLDVDTTAAVVQVAALDQLISNLSADVGLNVDTEDAARQLAALDTAIPDITTTIDADVNINETQALTEIEGLRRLLEDITANVRIDIDEASATSAVTEIRGLVGDLEATIEVNADSGPAITEIAALEAAVGRLRETVEIEVDLDGLRDALAEIAGVEAALSAVAAEDLNLEIDVDVEGVSAAIAELATLEAAAEALDRRIVITVAPGETAGTIAELGEIQGLAEYVDGFSDLSLAVDLIGAESTIAQLTTISALVTEIERRTVNIRLDLDGASSTLSSLAAVEGATRTIDGTHLIDIRALTGDTLATLGQLNAGFQAIPENVNTVMEVDGVLIGLQQLGFLNAEFDAIPNRVETTADFDAAKALAEAAIYRGELATLIPENIDTRVGVDRTIGSRVGGFSRIGSLITGMTQGIQSLFSGLTGLTSATSGVQSGLSGTASAASGVTEATTAAAKGASGLTSAFDAMGVAAGASGGGGIASALAKVGNAAKKFLGILLKFNLIGGALVTLAGFVAYLIPLATGLVGAAAGLLLFAGGATVAVGAVGALVFLLEDTMERFKQVFNGLRFLATGLTDALQPVIDLLLGSFQQVIGILGPRIADLANFFVDAFGPVIAQVLDLVALLLDVGGPIAIGVGEGLAKIIGTLTTLFEATPMDLVIESTEELFRLVDEIIILLGETGLQFPLVEVLASLADTVREAGPPFIEIINTFAQSFPAIAGGIAELFRPIGELGVVVGELFAQLAPQLRNLVELISNLLLPLANPEILTALGNSIIPALVTTLATLEPTIQRITALWVELVDIAFSPENLEVFMLSIESLALGMEAFMQVLADNPVIIETLIGSLLNLGTVAVALAGTWAFFQGLVLEVWARVVQGISQGVNQVLNFLGTLAGALSNIPGFEFFEGVQRTIDSGRGKLLDYAEGWVELGTSIRQAGAQILSGQWDAINDSTIAATTSNKRAAASLDRVTRATKRLEAAQQQLGAMLEFSATALEPIIAAGDSITDVNFSDILYEETEEIEKAARRTQGSLSEYFAVEGEEAAKTQDFYKKALEANSISDYMDRENLDIDRAIKSLVANLQLKSENVRRLNFIAALGFEDLTQELATLFEDPRMLSKAIDDLVAQGVGRLSEANGQIAGARGELANEFAQVNPAIAESLGLNEDEVNDAVGKTTGNLRDALSNAASDLQSEAAGIARVGQLYNAGFKNIAEYLYSIVDDPENFGAALQQINTFTQGELQRFENELAAGANAAEANTAALPEAFKIDAGLVTAQNKEEGDKILKSVQDIFNGYTQEVVKNADRVKKLTEIGKENVGVARLLAEILEDDPEAFDKVADELIAGGEAAIDKYGAQLGATLAYAVDATSEAASTFDAEFLAENQSFVETYAAVMGVTFDKAQELIEQGYTDMATARRELAQAERDKWIDELPAPYDPEKLPTGLGPLLGTSLGIGGQRTPGSGVDTLSDSIVNDLSDRLLPAFEDSGAQAAGSLQDGIATGYDLDEIEVMGGEIGEALVEGLNEALDIEGLKNDLSEIGDGIDYDSVNQWGESLGISYFSGFTKNASDNGDRIRALIAELLGGDPLVNIATFSGLYLGAAFMDELVDTVDSISPAVQGAVLEIFAEIGFGRVASAVEDVGDLLSKRFYIGLVLGLASGASTAVNAIGGLWLNVANIVGNVAEIAGRSVGLQFGEGLAFGVELSMRLVREQVITLLRVIVETVELLLDINSPSGVGISMGEFFGLGLAAGIRSQIESVRRASQDLTGAISTEIEDQDPFATLAESISNAAAGSVPVEAAQSRLAVALEEVRTPVPVSQSTIVSDAQVSVQGGTVATDQEQTRVLLQAILEAIRSNPTIIESLVDNYNVYGVEEPQSPQQFAEDVDFLAALVRS